MLDKIYEYISEYSDIPEEKIYQGYQNRVALPDRNEYILYYVSASERVGTNKVIHKDNEVQLFTLRKYVITIDINDYDQMRALKRANDLEIVSRSGIGVKFLKEREISLLHTENIRYMPFTDENNQYVHRYMLDLYISIWENVTIGQETAKEVKLNKIVNVDSYIYERKA